MTSIPRPELHALVKLVNSNQLLNRQLSSICQLNGLTSSGVKASLQGRIVNAIQEAFNNNDVTRFQQIQRSIETARTGASSSPASHKQGRPAAATTPVPMLRQDQQYWGNSRTARPGGSNGLALPSHGSGGPSFSNSPFYEIQFRVGNVRPCEAMTQHRNMVSIPVRTSENPGVDKVLEDKSLRIMVFCAQNDSGTQDISFPHQSEIKVNGTEVKANLRGLKNKPGSTRPVDVTSYLRLKNDYRNFVEFTYALTQKKFFLVLYACKITSAQELAEKIKVGKKIPKHKVIEESRFVRVTIEPDGQWRVNLAQDDGKPTNGGSGLVDDDDEDDWGIVEVNPIRSRNFETPNRSVASTATPTTTIMSRESSAMPRGVGTTSGKRLHSDRVTIDLTLSDDDEPVAPPPKRQQLQGPGSYTNGYGSGLPY
ncbi:MIZ/SP-RING zinc finger [Colletotrichum higginsianum]|nr:MIZ/SP-RING zinc finger [Colletotrichum higginsianum]